MAGENIFLWQVQASGAAARASATTEHLLSFNNTGKVPSGGAYIDSIDIDFRRAVPENEAVDADNNEIQDMGIGGLDIILHGYIGNADSNLEASNGVNKLSLWLQEGNTTTGYTKGRYGLEFDNAPQWDVVPSSTYGYHIRNAHFKYMGDKKDMVEFTVALALGGDLDSALMVGS